MSKYEKGSKLWYEREASEDEFLKWYHKQDQSQYEKPSVTVDLIGLRFNTTSNHLQVLMVQRIANPERGKWALPGGFIKPNETTYDAVKREVKEETNIDIDKDRVQLLPLVSTPNRDPRMWVMTNPNIILFSPDDQLSLQAGDNAQAVKFFDVTNNYFGQPVIEGLTTDEIAFDHYKLIINAIRRLQTDLQLKRYEKILPMLPQQFILAQVLDLFKALDFPRFKKYDNSNIKRILKDNIKQVSTLKLDGIRKPFGLYTLVKPKEPNPLNDKYNPDSNVIEIIIPIKIENKTVRLWYRIVFRMGQIGTFAASYPTKKISDCCLDPKIAGKYSSAIKAFNEKRYRVFNRVEPNSPYNQKLIADLKKLLNQVPNYQIFENDFSEQDAIKLWNETYGDNIDSKKND